MGTREVDDNTFTYQLTNRDNTGAITQKSETINGTTTIYNYTYDTIGRLTEVQKDGTTVEEYSYDDNGNRASATVNGVTTTGSYTLDDQLIVYEDNTYLYDDDGYLTQKTTPNGATTYEYGTLGELKKVTTPTKTIEYLHNANNQRVAKKVDGVIVEKYLWANLTTLLAVYDGSDNLVQRFEYTNGRMPIAMTMNGSKYYLHYDQVGSLRAVSDSSHNIIKEVVYDSYGNILSDSNEAFSVPFGFAGGLYDSDTKLTRFGYRDYDSFTGKWTAKDPILFNGGDSNLYGYVLGDPVGFVDPRGENPLILLLWIVGLSEYLNSPDVGESPQSGPTGASILLPLSPLAKPAQEFCTVTRWGRPGLESGDWVMMGEKNPWNYFWSGKWQPGMGNQFASYRSGESFIVPRKSLSLPRGTHWADKAPFNWTKYPLGQRMYTP